MRIGIGAVHLGNYSNYPNVSTVDPSVTYESCLPYLCGAKPFDRAGQFKCAMAGYSGNPGCNYPDCKPYCPNQAVEAQVTKNADVVKIPAKLTPENIQVPIPDITARLAPGVQQQECSTWQKVNQAIEEHPCVSVLVLFGTFFVLKGVFSGR